MDTTGIDSVSSAVPDNQTMTPADEAFKRAETIKKVVARVREAADRLILIAEVAKKVLPDLIAKDPLGAVVDHLEDLDLVIGGSKTHNVTGLEGATSAIKQVLAYAKEVSMPARMDQEQVTTFNTEENRVTRLSKVFASIIADEDAEDPLARAYEWLRANDYGSLIKETVNASSLSAAAKELMEGGRELPDDMFRVHPKDSISITRKRK